MPNLLRAEPPTVGKAVEQALLEATVIICIWMAYCFARDYPYPSWTEISIVGLGWLVATMIRHGVVRTVKRRA